MRKRRKSTRRSSRSNPRKRLGCNPTSITAQALSNGYVFSKSTNPTEFRSNDLYTEIYKEHGTYQVRQFDRREDGGKVEDRNSFRVFWKSFRRYSDAVRLFKKQPGKYV